MSDAVMVPREPTDEMLRAHLACDFPAMFREHLRYPMAGPDTAADQERMIAKARKRWSAMLAASPSVGGWEEPVAWRVRGPRGGWMHSDKLPSSWRNAEPLYAVPPPVSTGSRPQEAVPTEWSERPEVVLQYAQQVATFAAKRVGCVDEWRPLGDVYGCLTQIDNCLTGLTATPQPAEGCSRNEGAE